MPPPTADGDPGPPSAPLDDARDQQALGRALHAGERVLWAGRPDPGRYAQRVWPPAVTGLAASLFGLGWMLSVGLTDGWPPEVDWRAGLVFLVPGLLMLAFPALEYAKGRGSLYLVTTDGVVVIRRFPGFAVERHPPHTLLEACEVTERGDTGDVVFGYDEHRMGALTTPWVVKRAGASRLRPHGFWGIAAPWQVARLITATFG